MNIKVSCTSYLPPRNPAWKVLESDNKLIFGEFGDWPQVLTAKLDKSNLFWVVFLEDILPNELMFKSSNEDIEKAKSIIDSVFDALHLRLGNSTSHYTFLAWLTWQPDSIIRSARQKTINTIIGNYFEERLYRLTEHNKRLFLIPLDIVFGEEGYNNCIDKRNFFIGRIRLSQKGLKLLSSSLYDIILRIKNPKVKLLVLDCDNTLWGGVIGENGLGNILIGQDGIGNAFSEFQSVAKQLSDNGLLLAISSKNEEKDVWSVFDNHSSMVLKRSNIINSKIDWREKSIHLCEIANEIGIGLDSIVFWDDNPIEREKVKQSLPKVIVIEPPLEVVEWADELRSLNYFASFVNSKDDLNKISQYKAKAAFEAETNTHKNYDNFLANIKMEPSILSISSGTVARAVQLCQKTNQMNLRLVRYDELALKYIINLPRSMSFLVHLKDKFGDHGIISLVVVRPTENYSVAFLDTFLMSCRVLGRSLDAWIFNNIKLHLQKKGFKKLEAEFIQGERNSAARSLLPDLGFTLKKSFKFEKNKISQYEIDLTTWKIENLSIFDKK